MTRDKLGRVVAGGLLLVMATSLAACDLVVREPSRVPNWQLGHLQAACGFFMEYTRAKPDQKPITAADQNEREAISRMRLECASLVETLKEAR
jgi:hypothetical protein